jgi:hypothetical protein
MGTVDWLQAPLSGEVWPGNKKKFDHDEAALHQNILSMATRADFSKHLIKMID